MANRDKRGAAAQEMTENLLQGQKRNDDEGESQRKWKEERLIWRERVRFKARKRTIKKEKQFKKQRNEKE